MSSINNQEPQNQFNEKFLAKREKKLINATKVPLQTLTKARIIACVNQKGGVGKTTTVVNIATAFAAIGARVLIVDFDPQGNATTAFGIDKRKCQQNIYSALVEGVAIESIKVQTNIGKLDILPSNVDLSAAEIELDEINNREFVLKQHLASVSEKYDYIFIDCPPSLGLLTVNALASADSILIPIQCEFYALEGLSHLLKTYQAMKRNFNKNLEIEGAVLTMYDKRCDQTHNIENEIRSFLGDKVYNAVIPRNVKLSEAPSFGIPGIMYDLSCSGSTAYIDLAKEMMNKMKASQNTTTQNHAKQKGEKVKVA